MEKAILVRSFMITNVNYTVSLNEDSSITRFTCLYMTQNCMVCKHMFMDERRIRYTICYESNVYGESLEEFPQSSDSLPLISTEGFDDPSSIENLQVTLQTTSMAITF